MLKLLLDIYLRLIWQEILSVDSSDRRLADHFGGKLHLGYMQIREKLAELQVSVSLPNLAYEYYGIFQRIYFFLYTPEVDVLD